MFGSTHEHDTKADPRCETDTHGVFIFCFFKPFCLRLLMVSYPFHLEITYLSILVLALHLSLTAIMPAPSPIGRGEPLRYGWRGVFGVVYALWCLHTLLRYYIGILAVVIRICPLQSSFRRRCRIQIILGKLGRYITDNKLTSFQQLPHCSVIIFGII